MNRTWSFTDLEFVVLWETLKEDLLPRPLTFLSRTPLYDDYLREKRETRQRLQATLDDGFGDVLTALARPDIRVLAHGWDKRGPKDPKGHVRLHAARSGEQAYLIEQLPGETPQHSSGFTITECEPLQLADRVVDRLPAGTAGRLGDITLPVRTERDELDYAYRRSRVDDPVDEETAETRRDRFLHTPAIGMGSIDVLQGISRFGPRGITRRRLEWRDLADDGRYVIVGASPPVARGTDAKQFTAMINVHLAEVIRAIKDERA